MGFNCRAIIKAFTPPIFVLGYREFKRLTRMASSTTSLSGAHDRGDHRKRVGGIWDEMGQLQFRFILENGLLPCHKLLDVGCGSLRGGVHFANYLSDGNYYGIDKEKWLLDTAREIELPRYGLSKKTVHLLCRDDFDFSAFGVEFDYAIAQSVFTHLTWNSILRCLINMEKVLKEDGKFYATFFEDKTTHYGTDPMTHSSGGPTTYLDKDPYHYKFDVFVELANKLSLDVMYIGEWGHPKGQMMMVFTKSDHHGLPESVEA